MTPHNGDSQPNNNYAVKVAPDAVVTSKDPNNRDITITHAYPLIRDFPNGLIPDDVNPRSHDKLPTRLADTIEESLIEAPKEFHLRNRGITILAEKSEYDPKTQTLHFNTPNPAIFGVVDGATTDRVLARMKKQVPEFDKLQVEKLPKHFQTAHVHIEVMTGDIGEGLVPLAAARNTSVQVKEFALENLGGGFEWIKEQLKHTEFADRIKYRENDAQPVDIREILGLLTLFHIRWNKEKREPIVAYAAKGRVLEYYQSSEWRPGYEMLKNITPDILRLYDHVHIAFPKAYEAYKTAIGSKARFGMRKEVKFKDKGTFNLPLTQQKTQYLIPDGWIYPILAAFRMLLKQDEGKQAEWYTDPFRFFDQIGASMVADVVDQSEAMNRNPVAVGRSRPLWNSLRKSVEMRRLNLLAGTEIETFVEQQVEAEHLGGEPTAPVEEEKPKRGRKKNK